ncbi:hypothetical protein C8R45DRAFT_1102301 [Mycena sanguinolenta]|nr:hypothetical protein C8R45DRAFT_1102301 [Mycena sanguinolenta]
MQFAPPKRNLRQAVKLRGPFDEERPEDSPSSHVERSGTGFLARSSISFGAMKLRTMRLPIGYLAAAPDVHPRVRVPPIHCPRREEVPRVVAERGCTKHALRKIHKTESFLRESRHMNRIGILVMPRSVANPTGFRFSDGTVVPHGAFLEHRTTLLIPARLRDEHRAQHERGVF